MGALCRMVPVGSRPWVYGICMLNMCGLIGSLCAEMR